MDEKRFYGLYRGICMDTKDPEKSSRIKLQVPQVLGTMVTNWAWPCRAPATDHEHPDHKFHTAAQIAVLLDASVDSGGDPAHTHTASIVSLGGELDHAHEPTPGVPAEPEHSPHVSVPKVGDGVWVMFEAGDPDLPVWMGIF